MNIKMPAKTELMYGNTQRFQRQTSQVGRCHHHDYKDGKIGHIKCFLSEDTFTTSHHVAFFVSQGLLHKFPMGLRIGNNSFFSELCDR